MGNMIGILELSNQIENCFIFNSKRIKDVEF